MATTLPPTPPFPPVTESAPLVAATPVARRIPGVRSPAMQKARVRERKILDVLGGVETLRAGGEDYLPKLTGESEDDYQFRLKLAGFFNAPRRLVKAMAGLIFQRPPKLGDDTTGADELAVQWEAWDDHGKHGSIVGRRLAERGIGIGFAGLLVDMPPTPPGGVSLADVARLNLRPYVVPIRHGQVVDTDWEMLGAERVLTYLELEETFRRALPGVVERQVVQRSRVLRQTPIVDEVTGRVVGLEDPTVELWERSEGDPEPRLVVDAVPLRARGGRPLRRIPFAPFLAGDHDELDDESEDEWLVRSPIQDLIDLALTWYQIFSERRNLTNRVCTQTPYLIGYVPRYDAAGKEIPLRMGPSEAILLAGDKAGAGFLAPSADGFLPTEHDLDAMERRMAAMGLAFLMSDTRAAETAEGKRLDATAQNATLAAIAHELQDCLETALGFHAEYLGVTAPSLTVNTDFERITADPMMIDALSKLAQAGQISLETLLTLLERWSVLPDGFDIAAEVEKVRGLAHPVPGAPAVGGSTGAGTSVLDQIGQAMAAAVTNVPPAGAAAAIGSGTLPPAAA